MNFLWNCVTKVLAAVGLACWFCAFSASDYYVMTLHTAEPAVVSTLFKLGAILMIPAVFKFVKGVIK